MNASDFSHKMPCPSPELDVVRAQLLDLRKIILDKEKNGGDLSPIHPRHHSSARNLLQYLAFRSTDLREIQYELTNLGLSSLGGAELKVQANIDSILQVLHALLGEEWNPPEPPPICLGAGRKKLMENATALFGERPRGRRSRIMVTMPTEAAYNYGMIYDLILNGMNVVRINCAHDTPEIWDKIIANVHHASKETGRSCHIHMDLGGPKLRTGPMNPEHTVAKVRPHRNPWGKVLSPALVWLYPKEQLNNLPRQAQTQIPVTEKWLKKLKIGDQVRFTDARGSNRKMFITSISSRGCRGELYKTAYFIPGMTLQVKHKRKTVETLIETLPDADNFLLIEEGDVLTVNRNLKPGEPAKYDAYGKIIQSPQIGCTLPEALAHVQPGEPIWFDDGKIGGVIETINDDAVQVRIVFAKSGGVRLRAEKGINLPDSKLDLNALTEEDIHDLDFVISKANTIGLSFANKASDVRQLVREIRKKGSMIPGIILKIETKQAFNNLPEMLLASMEIPFCGVMIARGDLAIECGFERLAELQEEILWICEAAHVPVIWATQVLEGLTKTGVRTRAEVTDAAMGQRAECIMLNKGEHVITATKTLDDILRRMQDHQTKKKSILRKLRLAERFFESSAHH